MVTIAPPSDQLCSTEPPSWEVMLRLNSLLPKPPSSSGGVTGGPPRSVQTITTSLSRTAPATSSTPVASDSAPYFIELVASSCRTMARAVAPVSPTDMRGTDTRIAPAERALIVIGGEQNGYEV